MEKLSLKKNSVVKNNQPALLEGLAPLLPRSAMETTRDKLTYKA